MKCLTHFFGASGSTFVNSDDAEGGKLSIETLLEFDRFFEMSSSKDSKSAVLCAPAFPPEAGGVALARLVNAAA